MIILHYIDFFFFFQAEDGIRDGTVTGVQTCALPISPLAALSHLVRPGGRIVLSVMNRWCVAEIVLLAGRGRVKEAFRRTRSSLRVAVGSNFTEVSYPSWHELRQALDARFRVVSVQALP